MDASSFFGLIGVAAILGALAGAPFGKRRTRIVVAAAVAALAFFPFFPERTSLVERAFAFWDVPAIPTVFFAVYFAIFRRRNAETGAKTDGKTDGKTDVKTGAGTETAAESNPTAGDERTFSLKIWRGALVVFGLVLYASELNFLRFDVYRLGYSNLVGFAATFLVLATGERTASTLTAAAFVATSCGLYANFFDSILDFGFWIALVVSFLIERISKVARKKKTSAVSR